MAKGLLKDILWEAGEMRKSILVSLFFCFLLAYIIRVLFLSKLALTFGYDQARDAYVTGQLLSGDLKILGPPASTPGLYHGVFYYYLLAPAYLLGNGSPIIAAYWIAFLNSLVTFIVFYLAFLLVKKWGAALLAAALFAISWESTQYATWLSNPTIGIWTVPLIYLGLWAWIAHKKWWGPLVSALGLGLSIHANIFLAYHIPPLLLWLWLGRKRIFKVELLKFILVFLLTISTILVSEVKFGFKGLNGVASLFLAQDQIVLSRGLGDFIILYLNQLGKVFAYSSYPGNVGYGGIFVLALLLIALFSWNRKKISWQPFLATWLFSHITVTSVGGTSTPFLLVGIAPAVSILLGISLAKWWAEHKKVLVVVLLIIIVMANVGKIFRDNPNGSTIFAIQKDMLLKKQLAAIDHTYKEAGGEAFSINSLTSPLWINIVWTYLYKWYGGPKYGYIPQWHGRDQIGQLDSLPKVEKDTKAYFLIIEPLAGIPREYLPKTLSEEDSVSKLIDEQRYGEIIVQKRVKI